MSESPVVEVYAALDANDAHLMKARLAEAGIEASVVGETLRSAAGGLPLGLATAPRVWVARADEDRARQLVQVWEIPHKQSGGEGVTGFWNCPRCHRDIDEPFELCWNCGTARDGTDDPTFQPERTGAAARDFEHPRWEINPRAMLVIVLLAAVLMAACWSVGASVALLAAYIVFSNLFSGFVGWVVNLLVPPTGESAGGG